MYINIAIRGQTRKIHRSFYFRFIVLLKKKMYIIYIDFNKL